MTPPPDRVDTVPDVDEPGTGALARARRRVRTDPALVLVPAAVICAVAVVLTPQPLVAAVAFGAFLTVVAAARPLLSGRGLTVALLLVVMLVPMRQYTVVDFEFALEPFRLLFVLFVGALIVTLLVDPDVEAPRRGFGPLVAAVLVVSLLSAAANIGRIADGGLLSDVIDAFLNLGSVLGVYFLVRFVVRTREDAHLVLAVMLVGGAVVSLLALFERRIGMNVFQEIDRVLPLRDIAGESAKLRGGHLRAFGSAQHPIALGALLLTLTPFGVYMAAHSPWPRDVSLRTRQVLWGAVTMAIFVGAVVTTSRTIVLMGVVAGIVALVLRPRAVWRLVLIAFLLAPAVRIVAPGAVGGIRETIWPIDSLVAEQEQVSAVGDPGRLGDIGPTLEQVEERPLFGIGFGTRIVVGPRTNARILDNEYLGRLLETGIVGLVAFVALMTIPVRRSWQMARAPSVRTEHSDLGAALAVSLAGLAAGFLVFDGLAYGQVMAVHMALLAVGGWLMQTNAEPEPSPGVESADRQADGAVAAR